MPKGTATSNDTLNATLRGVDPAWRSGANRYIALYTATPGVGGSAETNEADYGGYARKQVTAATDFTAASGGSSENANLLQFPEATSGSNTLTYAGIVTTASGPGQILYLGALNASRVVTAGIQPQFAAGTLVATET